MTSEFALAAASAVTGMTLAAAVGLSLHIQARRIAAAAEQIAAALQQLTPHPWEHSTTGPPSTRTVTLGHSQGLRRIQ